MDYQDHAAASDLAAALKPADVGIVETLPQFPKLVLNSRDGHSYEVIAAGSGSGNHPDLRDLVGDKAESLVPDPDPTAAYPLYASTSVRARLGWMAERISAWAGMPILLLSKADLPGLEVQGAGAGSAPDAQATQLRGQALAHFHSFVAGYPTFPIDRLHISVHVSAAINAARAWPTMAGFSSTGSGPNDSCIIVLPDLEASVIELAGLISLLPSDQLRSLPGSADEWRAFIIAHEAGHCAQHYPWGQGWLPEVALLANEIEADQHAIGIYSEELQAGNLATAEVPEAIRDLRALTAIVFGYVTHATSPALDLPGETPPAVTDAGALRDGLAAARMRILRQLPVRPTPRQIYRAARALHDQGIFDHDPVQARYVARFLKAAERYAPGYFGAT